jgi:hypothetical protein
MLAELADSTSEHLPGPIFDYLPHSNPLVVFPEPIPTTTPDGARGQILGFFVYGNAGQPRRLCSSHDEHRDGLGLMFITALVDEQDNRLDIDLTRVTIPVGQDQFTVEQAVDGTLAKFGLEPGMLVVSERLPTPRLLPDLLDRTRPHHPHPAVHQTVVGQRRPSPPTTAAPSTPLSPSDPDHPNSRSRQY